MDKIFISYTLSFISVLVLIYVRMRKQVLTMLESKQKEVQGSLKTAEYIKNFSLFSLYEETKIQDSIDEEILRIKKIGKEEIAKLYQNSKKQEREIQERLDKMLRDESRKINVTFIQETKKLVVQKIIDRIIAKLHIKSKKSKPVEEFISHFKRRIS